MKKTKNKILVTGGAGFIGSEFVRFITKKGYKAVVIDSLTYAGDLKRLNEIKGRYKFYKIDICDKNKTYVAGIGSTLPAEKQKELEEEFQNI